MNRDYWTLREDALGAYTKLLGSFDDAIEEMIRIQTAQAEDRSSYPDKPAFNSEWTRSQVTLVPLSRGQFEG